MIEMDNSRKERARQYSALTTEISTTIRDFFPDAYEEEFWQQKEYQISENLLITLGYDGENKESILIVEEGNEEFNEVRVYSIKGEVVRKDGFVAPPVFQEGEVLQFTDSEKTKAEALENNPNTKFRPSLRIGLDELKIVAEIINNPEENSNLVTRLPSFPRIIN